MKHAEVQSPGTGHLPWSWFWGMVPWSHPITSKQ